MDQELFKITDLFITLINNYNKTAEVRVKITVKKLMQWLFILSMDYLKSSTPDKPLFKSKFYAWDSGPVIPELYYTYVEFPTQELDVLNNNFDVNSIDNKIFSIANKIFYACKYLTFEEVEEIIKDGNLLYKEALTDNKEISYEDLFVQYKYIDLVQSVESKAYSNYKEQYEYTQINNTSLPEIGKTYHYFDDGKIRESRHSVVKILNIIKVEDADRFMTEFFNRIKSEYDWIFDEKQDYFIIGYNETDCPGVTMLFARSGGDWYGFETSGEDYWTGRLITNPDFNYEKFIGGNNNE